MKILLVDDEYYILNGLYQLIHARFPELEIFTGDYVTKAREILYREEPDILITDIRIAEENGLDFIKALRQIFPICMCILSAATVSLNMRKRPLS